MLGVVLVAVGLALLVAGVRLATGRPRPLDLVGALLAPAGLILAFVGAGRILAPDFLAPAPARPALRVMPAGDSITQGSYGAGKNGIGGYRAPLWRRLVRARLTVDLVGSAASGPFTIDRDHESWNGISIGELGRHLERDLPTLRPDLVLLHIGTNDLIAGAPPDTIEGRLAALVDGILAAAPGARIAVSTLIGVRVPNDYRVDPARLDEVNARIRRLVVDRAAQRSPIELVDMNARALRRPGDFHDDGLHPGDAGYEQMAEVWFDVVRKRARAETR